MKLLLVAPGKMAIPNDGWGAIEIVIWQLKLHLEALGHKVTILNNPGREAALAAQPWNYDYVHLHFDAYASMWAKLAEDYRFELIVTSHHSYAAAPEHWNADYRHIIRSLSKIKYHLVLSPKIKEIYKNAGFTGKVAVLPNGTEIDSIKFSKRPGNGKAICLGKISVRKQQAKLSQLINQVGGLQCDFAGPIADSTFTCDDKNTFYKGKWNRRQVHHNLTGYSCLLLPSRGEAHALVILEALAAGLSVVVTSEASANLDQTLPFIYVDQLSEKYVTIASQACRDNQQFRSQIRSYAKQQFDWNIIAERYIKLLKKWKEG